MITLVLQKKTQLHFFEVNVFGLVTAVPDTLGDGKGVSRVKRHLKILVNLGIFTNKRLKILKITHSPVDGIWRSHVKLFRGFHTGWLWRRLHHLNIFSDDNLSICFLNLSLEDMYIRKN